MMVCADSSFCFGRSARLSSSSLREGTLLDSKMISELVDDSIHTTSCSDQLPPPPSRWHNDDSSSSAASHRVRLMCSSGGRILPRPQDHQLRYVGGDTRIVAVPRSVSFSTLLSKLSKIAGTTTSTSVADQLSIKYQLPNEDLDALISLTSDEDVENMMEEYDRLSASSTGGGTAYRTRRIRLFLFPHGSSSVTGAGAFGSNLDGSGGSKRDDWFLDALNGSGAVTTPPLERGRSEVSSIVSEVPDYLFGLDNNSDEPLLLQPSVPVRSKAWPAQESLSLSEPGSPAQVFGSGSLPRVPPITRPTTDLPPISNKPKDNLPVELQLPQQTDYVQTPIWQYATEPVPVCYVSGPVVPGGSFSGQPGPVPFPYAHQATGGPASFGYAQPVQDAVRNPIHGGPVYVGGTPMLAAAYELAGAGGLRSPTIAAYDYGYAVFPSGGIAPATAEPIPKDSDLKSRAQIF